MAQIYFENCIVIRNIMRKFDITEHEWSDEGTVSLDDSDDGVLEMLCDGPDCYNEFELNRNDAIAIAKHFKLTKSDLK